MMPSGLFAVILIGISHDGLVRIAAAAAAQSVAGRESGPRKGSSQQRQRHLSDNVLPTLQHRNTGEGSSGSLLRVFDQVFSDAASVRTTDTLVTECIKPPKKKKKKKGDNGSGDADFRADGTGGKSGKGKGSGKGGGGSSSSSESWSAASSSSSTTSSTNMIPVESPSSSGSSSGSSTSTSTITFNFNTARGKGGKGKKGKKGKGDDYNGDEYYNGDSGSSSVRFCEEDEYDDGDESDNVSDGGGTGVVAPGPGPMPAPPSATPQEGDNQATSPFASPPTEGMLPPTQPDSSVVGGGGGDSGESGGPSSGEEAVDDTPTISPNTFPVMAPSSSNSSSSVVGDGTGSNNTNVTFMGQESICAAFAAGRSPTLGPRQGHVVRLALNVRNETQIGQLQSIYRQMDAILQQRIAPLLLNCVDQRRRTKSGMRHGRRAQITTERSNRTEYVNAVFGNTTREPQRNCTQNAASVQCPTRVESDLYYNGAEPTQFGEQLRQAILFWDWNIDGLLGFGDVQVDVTRDDIENPTLAPSSSPSVAVTLPPVAAAASTPRSSPPVGNVAGIQDQESRDRRVNPGAFVAAGVAALTLVLMGVFVAKRQHDRSFASDSKTSSKQHQHRELMLDDSGDEYYNGDPYETDDNTAMTPLPPSPPITPKVYIVGDDESWNMSRYSGDGGGGTPGGGGGGRGTEIYAALQQPDFVQQLQQHGPHIQCSSPTCEVCELKRQSGTKFVVTSAAALAGLDYNSTTSSAADMPPRRYEADDTVSL